MKQKQLNNQIHYINLLYIRKQQMTSGTGNRNNIEIFLYSWRALLILQLELKVYQFICDRNLRTMRAKRTTCARQNTFDWIGL